MEREVAAMATQLESSVGLKRKEHVRYCNGGLVHKIEDGDGGIKDGDGGIIELAKAKGESNGDGGIKDGDGGIIELAKTKGESKEEGSSSTAKPAGRGKRTKKVKYRMGESKKHLFLAEPIRFKFISHISESFAASLSKFYEFHEDMRKQYETKGYADYETEVEVTDEEDH